MLNFDPATHTYTLDGVVLPSVTQILQSVGLINFSGISPDVLQRVADFGTAVHLATALDDVGDLDEETLDPNLWPYLTAWRCFRRDEMGLQKFFEIEQPLAHPDYGFAGTPDRIGAMIIIDIKTSTVVPPWTGLQLAAYSVLANITTARRIAVQLKGDGTYQIHEFKDRKDREIFLAALSVYKWREKNATS